MILERLKQSDPVTTRALLAKAALISDDAGKPDEGLDDALELLKEIRQELGVSEDAGSSNSRRLVDNFLVKAINTVVIGEANRDAFLSNAGRFGRLPPALYKIDRPDLLKMFYQQLGTKPNHIDDAITHPDEVQHLLSYNASSDAKQAISIFLKEVISRRPNDSFWLLVQTHRTGSTQVVQSAWRIYPNDVDLSGAFEPIHVLMAFVNTYGMPITVDGQVTKFLDYKNVTVGRTIMMSFPNGAGTFWSVSKVQTIDPKIVAIGIAYCIDLLSYREMLRRRKVVSSTTNGPDPFLSVVPGRPGVQQLVIRA